MFNGNLLTYGSVLYITLLMIIFYSRKRLKTLENKIYSSLIITNLFGLIIAIACYYTVLYNEQIPIINFIVSRIYLIYLVLFILIFFYYLIVTMYETNNTIQKRILLFFSIILAIMICLIFKYDLYFSNNEAVYSYGPAANIIYIFATLCMTTWTILLIINHKKIKNKKFVPIITFIIGAMITTIIQKLNPGLLLMTSMETFVIMIMYFTIENPDMKMLNELNKSKEISDNANEEKTIFLYNMTQDIKEITNKIDESANIILNSKNIEEIYDSAREIKGNSSKFITLTNDVFDVSTIDQANVKVYNSKYDIKLLIKEIINIYSKISKEKELKFITNIDNNIPNNLYGDNINLKEVLNIILNNSIKSTNKGFIEFDINTIIKNDICRLIITIEDSSNGIKSEDINSVLTENTELGKAQKILTIINGTMIISSNYGFGNKIKIILDQKIVIDEDSNIKKYKEVFDNTKILVIDDSKASIKIIEKLLKDTNVNIETVLNGKEALSLLKKNKYDLILLDEELSSISGKELLIKIKNIRGFKSKIILLTKDNNYEYNDKYIEDGFDDYILKPLKKDNLLSIIDKYKKE